MEEIEITGVCLLVAQYLIIYIHRYVLILGLSYSLMEKMFLLQHFFRLEDNCFTISCWFLLYNNIYVVHLTPHPSRSPWSTKLSVLHTVMYIFQCYSLYPSHPLLPPRRPQIHPLCLSLFPPWKQVHQYHFSRFHIYALIYDICFSFSDLLHSV